MLRDRGPSRSYSPSKGDLMRLRLTLFTLCLAFTVFAKPSRESLVVTPAWLAAHLNDADLVLLHVGDKDAYAAKHIPGARHVSLGDISLSDHRGKGLMLEMPPA